MAGMFGAVPCVWMVAFTGHAPGSRWRWWRLFTSPGFRHVMAFRAGAAGTVVLVNPRSDFTEVGSGVIDVTHFAIGLQQRLGARVLVAPVLPRPAERVLPVVGNCVQAVKDVLGLRAPFVWTPRQLHRRLVQLGAVEIATREQQQEDDNGR